MKGDISGPVDSAFPASSSDEEGSKHRNTKEVSRRKEWRRGLSRPLPAAHAQVRIKWWAEFDGTSQKGTGFTCLLNNAYCAVARGRIPLELAEGRSILFGGKWQYFCVIFQGLQLVLCVILSDCQLTRERAAELRCHWRQEQGFSFVQDDPSLLSPACRRIWVRCVLGSRQPILETVMSRYHTGCLIPLGSAFNCINQLSVVLVS